MLRFHPLPFESFLSRARAVHGDRYDYALARPLWQDTKHKVPIVCPDHGVFDQHPYNHLNGVGCPRCGEARMGAARRLSPAAIAERLHARGLHYELEPGTYSGVDVPATWRCVRHDRVFVRTLVCLLLDKPLGCPSCRAEAQRERLAAERQDPQAEAHLARVARVLGAASAELYRRWLAGERLSEIARGRGVTRECERLRLGRVRALLATADDDDPPSAT